jgi:hypothetical protein
MKQRNALGARPATQWLLRLSVAGLVTLAMPARAVNLVVTGLSAIESVEDPSSLRLRKLVVPNQGFKSGEFKWDAVKNSWVQQGALAADDKYYADIQIWKLFGIRSVEKLSLGAGGFGVTAIAFKSPKGVVYSAICSADGEQLGMTMFGCEKDLPVGQTEFGNGSYVVTYTLASGQQVSRKYYVSGDYPIFSGITYPPNKAVNVSLTPTVKWTAYGATGYDLIIRDTAQNDVYGPYITNATESTLTHTVPSGVLQRNTRYYLTIEANGPRVNGGTKGIKHMVEFNTGP